MCGAEKLAGGKSSTLVWNKYEQARRSITDTIWAFGCPFSCCLHSGITPRVPPTLKPQQKQRGSNIRTYTHQKNTLLYLMGRLAVLSVLTEVIDTSWPKSNCRMHLLCCSVRYFGAVQTFRCENHAKSCPVSGIFHIIFHTKVPQYTQNA